MNAENGARADLRESAQAGGSKPQLWQAICLACLLVAACFYRNSTLTITPNEADAEQNVEMAFSLAKGGSIASEPGGPPSMRREPLPIASLALQILLDPRLSAASSAADLKDPGSTIALKQQNLLWAALLLLGVVVQLYAISETRVAWFGASVIAILLVVTFFLDHDGVIDRNMTEVHAASLLVWCSALATLAVRRMSRALFLAFGISFGCLILTKAIFLYVAPVVILALFALMWLSPQTDMGSSAAKRSIGLGFCLATLGITVVVAPWMARNHANFGTLNVADRGGAVLWIRALYNDMTPEEWLGSVYVFAHSTTIGRLIGFQPADLERGGRLARLNRSPDSNFAAADLDAEMRGRPEDAISFYRKARAARTRLYDQYESLGNPAPMEEADKDLMREAVTKIIKNPVSHIKTTPLFLWRGTMALRSTLLPYAVLTGLSIVAMLALLIVTLWSIVRRRPDTFAWTGIAAGMVMLYAVGSHFIPRYSMPAVPTMLMLLSAGTVCATLRLSRKIRPRVAR